MQAKDIAARVVEEGVAPSCAAGCASRSGTQAWATEVGGAETLLFDLASVTKPMTAVAVVCAGIDPKTPLGDLLPEVRGTASAPVALELFLAHRAGLESHRSLYAPLLTGGAIVRSDALRVAADARRPEALGPPPEEGFAPLYSDLGYVLAGEALARTTGARDAGEAISTLVLQPLGLAHRAGTVRELAKHNVQGPFAPTEEVPWRGGRILGAVHDENAWALTESGGSGHAGIFGDVTAVLTFGMAVLDAVAGQGIWGSLSLHGLIRERDGGTLRAGFDGKSEVASSAGNRMSARSFGHLGFVGTSLWLDPDAGVAVTLLTNRVYWGRNHLLIRSARPWAHDLLWARAGEISGPNP